MRKSLRIVIGFVLSLAMMSLSVSGVFARGSSAKGLNTRQLAQLAVDIHEINNLMSLHAWYHAASMNDVELEENMVRAG